MRPVRCYGAGSDRAGNHLVEVWIMNDEQNFREEQLAGVRTVAITFAAIFGGLILCVLAVVLL